MVVKYKNGVKLRTAIVKDTRGYLIKVRRMIHIDDLCAKNKCNRMLTGAQKRKARKNGSKRVFCSRTCANRVIQKERKEKRKLKVVLCAKCQNLI